MKGVFYFFYLLLFTGVCFSQEDWDFDNKKNTDFFLDTRAINGHSVNVLEKKDFDFRITHRFGNIATPESYRTLFGLDNSSDIRIGFEYGISDKFMLGLGRSKGASPFLEVWDGLLKYQIVNKDKYIITAASSLLFTSMPSANELSSITHFDQLAHRLNYYSEIIAAFKPIKNLTIQGSIGFLHQNKVHYEDKNSHAVLGGTIRYLLFKKVSLITEYYQLLSASNYRENNFTSPFGMGIEIKTYGHVFQLNFMNSKGIVAGQFIPFTNSKWSEGEFRFGFTIARKFEL